MKKIAWIFWNAQQRRPRAGWRVLVLMLLLAGLLIGAHWLVGETSTVVSALGVLSLVLLATWVAARFLDRRAFADFGWHFSPMWWRDLGFGLALGIVLMAGIFLVEYFSGWVEITATFHAAEGELFWQSILAPVIVFICVGVQEELLFRGYLLKNLSEAFNIGNFGARNAVWLAVLVSSVSFGLAHVMNPNADAVGIINIVLAGVFLSYGYVVTRDLAIPIGMHISWNFFQGHVFGFPVSGGASATSFIAIEQGGPEVWTGGNFGPEAGLIGLGGMLVGILLTAWWVQQTRGHSRTDLGMAIAPARS